MQRKRKSRKGGSYSTLSLLRKELREGNLQSLLGGSSRIVSSSNVAADPLLSSFILPVADDFSSSQSQPNFLTGTRQSRKSSEETPSKKYVYFICQFSFFSEKKSPLVHYIFEKICLFLLVFLNVVVMSHCSLLLLFMQYCF